MVTVGQAPMDDGQLSLIGLTAAQRRRERSRAAASAPAEESPVARVVLGGMLPHLDREFDYLVTRNLAAQAVPGARVTVRMAGRDVDGYVLRRLASSPYRGELKPLRRVVSPLPVLTPPVLDLCRRVAADHAGGLGDVLRLAVPPRHATAEKEVLASPEPTALPAAPNAGDWASYVGAEAFLRRAAAGQAPRAVWTALPAGGDETIAWPAMLARAAVTVAAAGRGVVIVVPDGRDVARVTAALEALDPAAAAITARLTHDVGPAPRYEAFVRALTGRARIVVGTRQAAYAPVPDPGLLVCWDDLDGNHDEPRAPYPSSLRVLTTRSEVEDVALLVGSHSRSLAAAALLESGWAREVAAPRPVLRDRAAAVRVSGDDVALERDPGARSRLPAVALAAVRRSLSDGCPVLVCVPRLGYLRTLACARCREPASCPQCHGRLSQEGPDEIPRCGWCGRPAADFECERCGAHRLRSVTVGVDRTAEEIGRAFPQTRVVASSGDRVRDRMPAEPAVVVATPGAEPVAAGGYGAVLLLDSWLALARPTLDADEVALWRWLNAVALARSAPQGQVVLVGSSEASAVQALVRHDPAGAARRLLAEREELRLPPAAVFAEVGGTGSAVHDLLARLDVPPEVEILGPVSQEDGLRALLRTPADRRGELATALRVAMVRTASARSALPRLRVGVVPDA